MHGTTPHADAPAARLGISEAKLLLLVSAVQLVNILDFMMVMPLGPDFAKALAIPVTKLGFISGSYTAAAAVSGLVAARFLDRFDRRTALALSMLGLVIATALGGFAEGLYTLIAARVLAGAFGGPATSVSLSIVADVIPAERRGRAFGTVMAAFSVATVVGVPAGLELARLGTWRTPFFAVAAMGLVVAAAAVWMMPKLTLHLAEVKTATQRALWVYLQEPAVRVALWTTVTVMLAAFLVVPNISTYIQQNMHYPRTELSILYFAGGGMSFLCMQVAGRYVDRFSAAQTSLFGTALFCAVLLVTFVIEWSQMPVVALFIGFMGAMAIRNVSMGTLSSRVPLPHERARFMSIQSAVQHLSSATGAFLSSLVLRARPDHSLEGMPVVATVSIVLALALPVLLARCERLVRARDAGLSLAG